MADGQKLERWGNVILERPDPQIIWKERSFLRSGAKLRQFIIEARLWRLLGVQEANSGTVASEVQKFDI